MMLNTIYLNQDSWDIALDANGDFAIATPPYAIAQDVASAVKTFKGECFYDITQGIPYFQNVLGHLPPMSIFTALVVNSALSVPGVVSARCLISSLNNRTVTGQIQVIDETGTANNVAFH